MKYNPINEVMNVTQISHLFINPCVKCVFDSRYQCMKCMNYEWTNFAWLLLLSHEMLSPWCIAKIKKLLGLRSFNIMVGHLALH
jgi:hypothetical protein